MSMAVTTSTAPGALEHVRAFVNTLDLESGADEIADPDALRRWLEARGLVRPGTVASLGDVEEAAAVREALRALLVANGGGPLDPRGPSVLDAAARRAGMALRFGPDGLASQEPSGAGAAAGLGRLLGIAAIAMTDGTWSRLKACRAGDCRWAYYDGSRNRSRRWCSMAVCGNRTKARAYRARSAAA